MKKNTSLLQKAQHCLNSGDAKAAALMAGQFLKACPENGEAWHLLGLALFHLKRMDDALAALNRAAVINPGSPLIRHNFGLVLLEAGRVDQAICQLGKAISLNPKFAEAHFNLGNAFMRMNRPQEAIPHYERAISYNPNHINALYNMGAALRECRHFPLAIKALQRLLNIKPDHRQGLFQLALTYQVSGNLNAAVENYQALLSTEPGFPGASYNLGVCYHEMSRFEDAIKCFRNAISINPGDARAFNYLGLSLEETGQTDEAAASYKTAIMLDNSLREAHSNLANILMNHGEYDQAINTYKESVSLDPVFFTGWYNLGNCFMELNRLDDAIDMYRTAIKIKPDFVEAHWNLSHALLKKGAYKEGFREYLWRWNRKDAPVLDFTAPLWNKKPLKNGALLVHAEQGFGDAIQFIRYIPLLRRYASRILLACDRSLIDLFSHNKIADHIIDKTKIKDFEGSCDAHIPLLNLPSLFTDSLETIPSDIPYIAPDKSMADYFADIVTGEKYLKIGLVWKGNPGHKNDKNRSCLLDDLAPLLDVPQTRFFSLQKEGGTARFEDKIIDLSKHLETFSHTAGAIHHLDLIITVDTSVAHLAGAMGRPVWLLLPYVPEWRWLLDTESTPWYPTMKLFRQHIRGDWSGPVSNMEDQLVKIAASR